MRCFLWLDSALWVTEAFLSSLCERFSTKTHKLRTERHTTTRKRQNKTQDKPQNMELQNEHKEMPTNTK